MTKFSRAEKYLIKNLPLEIAFLPVDKKMPHLRQTLSMLKPDRREIIGSVVIAMMDINNAEGKKLDYDKHRSSLIYKLAVWWAVIPIAFGVFAIVLAYLKVQGTSKISIFGQTIETSSAIVACVFIGVVSGVLVARDAIKRI